MDNTSRYKNHLNQSIMVQLRLALKSLDLLGNSIAAAHVDAAIQSLQSISEMDSYPFEMDESPEQFHAKTDVSRIEYKLTISPCGKEECDADFLGLRVTT